MFSQLPAPGAWMNTHVSLNDRHCLKSLGSMLATRETRNGVPDWDSRVFKEDARMSRPCPVDESSRRGQNALDDDKKILATVLALKN